MLHTTLRYRTVSVLTDFISFIELNILEIGVVGTIPKEFRRLRNQTLIGGLLNILRQSLKKKAWADKYFF